MRRGCVVWALPLLLMVPVALAASATVEGDLEYEQGARIQGHVAAGPGAVLTSVPSTTAAPDVAGFHLVAEMVEATLHQNYIKTAGESPIFVGRSSSIHTTGEKTERRTFHSADLTLYEATAYWNVVAFVPPDASASLSLPSSDYSLSNADPDARLLGPGVPVPQSFSRDLAAPRAVLRDGLVLTSTGLTAILQGDFVVALYGGSFDVTSTTEPERLVTGHYDETVQGDELPLPEPRSVNATAFLRVTNGVLSMAAGNDLLELHARDVAVKGRVVFEHVTGTLDVNGQPTTEVPRSFEGDLLLTSRGAPYEDAQGTRFGPVRIEGTTFVPVPSIAASLMPTVAAAVGGASLLGAAVRWLPGPQRFVFAFLALFSMVKKDEALGMKSRGQLYDHVRANPGTNLSDVQRVLGLGWGTTLYHVSVLERLDMVVTKRVGGRRLLFVNGASRIVDPAAWSALQNGGVRRLAAELLLPGRRMNQAEVASMLDFSPQYAGRLLRRLESVGLVAKENDTARLCYQATPMMQELAQRAGIVPTPIAAPIAAASTPVNA